MTLMEREEQLRAAAGYLAEAATGHGRLAYVGGEAGIGKSSYVGQVLEDATGSARAVVGSCDGSATPAPLGPLVEILPGLPGDVWPTDATRQEVFARLMAALREPAGGTPYLLVIEDAHWADEATLDLVRHLARRVHTCRALVLDNHDAPRELRLQIDDGSLDLHGRLIDPAGDQQEFDGWLELLHLLGEAIDLPPSRQPG